MLHPSRYDVLTRRDSRCAGVSSVVSSYCRMSCTRFAAQTDARNQHQHRRKSSQLSARILGLERRQNRNMLTNLQSKQGAERHTPPDWSLQIDGVRANPTSRRSLCWKKIFKIAHRQPSHDLPTRPTSFDMNSAQNLRTKRTRSPADPTIITPTINLENQSQTSRGSRVKLKKKKNIYPMLTVYPRCGASSSTRSLTKRIQECFSDAYILWNPQQSRCCMRSPAHVPSRMHCPGMCETPARLPLNMKSNSRSQGPSM